MNLHINAFDRYEPRESLVHHLDPRVKVIVTILYVVSNALLPDGAWLAFGLAWGLVLLANALAELSLDYALRRSFVALPFALAAVSAIVAMPGERIASWTFGPWDLVATDTGMLRFVSVVVRSWLSVQMAIILTATTQFPDILHALRHLWVPRQIVAIISFMYRYLFILTDEAVRLLRAREARSAQREERSGGGSIAWRARVAGNMAGQLFLRSYERSDRVYNAMLARGYSGRFMTLNPHVMKRHDWAAGAIAVILLAALQLIGRISFLPSIPGSISFWIL